MDTQTPADDAKLIAKYVKRVRTLLRQSHTDIVEIGRHLHKLRELVPHGEWLKFLAEHVKLSQSSAHRYIAVYKAFGAKSFSENDLANIDANAMFVLGAEDVPDAAVDEALDRAKQGEHVTAETARQITGKPRRRLSHRTHRKRLTTVVTDPNWVRLWDAAEVLFRESGDFHRYFEGIDIDHGHRVIRLVMGS